MSLVSGKSQLEWKFIEKNPIKKNPILSMFMTTIPFTEERIWGQSRFRAMLATINIDAN